MFRSLFFRRLFIPYVLVVCAVALVVGLLGWMGLHDAHIDQARRLLRSTAIVTADLLKPDVVTQDHARLQQRVEQLGKTLGYRITVIGSDPDGKVLADSEANPATMAPHRLRPEVVQAFSSRDGEGWSVRTSDTIHRELLYYAKRVDLGGSSGFIRIALYIDDLNASLQAFYFSLAVATGISMLLAGASSYYLAHRQAVPIVEVTAFADAIAKGQLNRRILRSDRGELGHLAVSLNSMADSFAHLLKDAQKDKTELRTILTSMSEGVIATDSHCRILLVNDAAARLLEFPLQSAEGKVLWEVVRHEPLLRAMDEVTTTGQRRQFQFDPTLTRHVEITICPFPHAAGPGNPPASAAGLIIVIHDITQALRYQDLRKEFVANVSHELRTPLTVIKGYVETLRDGAVNDPLKRDEYLATIERHTNQLTNLVNDLLEISKLESQTVVPRRSSIDLKTLVQRVVDLLEPTIEAKHHTIEVRASSVLPPLVGNADYLERALINLIENAIKYTPANSNGKVTIDLRADEATVTIEVADNGIGIPEQDIPRVFERFYRVDRSRSREMGGTGLGLAIVKHIVQTHGGSIEVQSELGKGSRFRVLLPLGRPQQ